ncbi:hypothetical protein GS504_01100 [Rhodococcus hoagii]|nr:hypothetical protein [Prescottella equi]NKS71730.1 hypothetical protein [Prescottella equi]
MTPAQIIAKVLREHPVGHRATPGRSVRSGDLDAGRVQCGGAGCDDWAGENAADHAQHVTEKVLAALQADHEIVALPEGVPDDDGQTWFDDGDIRVDHTGRHGPTIHLLGTETTAQWLRRSAAQSLGAARDADGEPLATNNTRAAAARD